MTNDLNQDQRMHRICDTLQQAGYNVTLIGRQKSDSTSLYEQSFVQHRLPMFFQSGVLFYLEYQIRLCVFLLFAKSPRLMYSVDLDTALPIRLAALLRRSPTIHDAHELFTEVPELLKSPIKRWIWKTVGKLTMKGFNSRITVNESLSKILGETYGCDFISIRNLPASKMKSRAKLEYERPYIWYQGVLNEGRGLEEMIEAMSSIPEVDLRIAGEGGRSKSLRLLAEQSKAHDRIHFHGWMNPRDMHDWACNAWIGINLLDSKAGNYYHSLANRTFDYVQAELPALHMDFPEYRAVIEKYRVGELLTKLEVHYIVERINSLLVDHTRYDLLRNSCQEVKKALTWESESIRLFQIVKSLL